MRRFAAWILTAALATPAIAAVAPRALPTLSAAQIVDKNVAARGGLEAWQKIQTMVWVGHVEAGDGSATGLPFLLEMKRPDKTRFEVKTQGARSVRAFDGIRGWKLRAGSNGQPVVQPYSADELRFERDSGGIDGPLMDYHAKGIAVALDGIDEVEGRKAYRLNVTLPSGASHHVWIDAENFLDIKYDRTSRNLRGRSDNVAVYYRNYRSVEGVQVPFLIESGVEPGKATEKLVIERIALNAPLEDRLFARPVVPHPRRGAMIDIPASLPPGSPLRPGARVPPPLSRLSPSAAAGGGSR